MLYRQAVINTRWLWALDVVVVVSNMYYYHIYPIVTRILFRLSRHTFPYYTISMYMASLQNTQTKK
jgi:hypothetical protein